jgi:hypothetical protein
MANQLDVSSAQELLRVADPAIRAQIVEQALAGDWSRLRIRQEVDKWNVDIPEQLGRAPIDGRLESILHELERITPESLTPEEQQAASRLMRRLMWMLGPIAGAPEAVETNDSATEPRILGWIDAPA